MINSKIDGVMNCKILNKLVACIKDLNFLIAEKTITLLKSNKAYEYFNKSKLGLDIMKNLIFNSKFNYNIEIQIMSKLAIFKIMEYDKEIINRLDSESKSFCEAIDIKEFDEEGWGVRFDLKAD